MVEILPNLFAYSCSIPHRLVQLIISTCALIVQVQFNNHLKLRIMKFTEIPECWKLSVMYKADGLSRSINVKYKTKELAEQEMRKQWKEFCKRYDVAEKDCEKFGTFSQYAKNGLIYISDVQRTDAEHIYEEPIDIAAPAAHWCSLWDTPMSHSSLQHLL